MKLSIIVAAAAATIVSAAPAVPAEVLKGATDGTIAPACTVFCYPAGGTTQCYCF